MINNTNESQDDDLMTDTNSHQSETTTNIIGSTIPNVTTATTQHDDNPKETHPQPNKYMKFLLFTFINKYITCNY